MLRQGTISVLFGVHSPFHSLLVLLSWRKLYGRWPRSWQIACIFLHDIGHWGRNYLDSQEEKGGHWLLGAKIAGKFFGEKGFWLIEGHRSKPNGLNGLQFNAYGCRHTAYISALYRPDKYSWYIAPCWWLWWNCIVEPEIAMGFSRREAVGRFRAQVKQSIESGEYRSTHQMYLDRCRDIDRCDG